MRHPLSKLLSRLCPQSQYSKGFFLVICGVLLSLGILPLFSQAQAGVFDAISNEVKQVYKQSAPAVVRVGSVSSRGPLLGTSFFIDDQGTLIASYDVVRNASKAWVEYEGKKVEARILGRDLRTQLAILKIDRKNTPYLKMGNSDQLQVASGIISIAYPFDLPSTPSFGLITGFDVRYGSLFFATTHIRAGIKVSPGQIGGPMLDSQGRVVGVLSRAILGGQECYGLPVNALKRVLGEIKQNGQVNYGWVGVGAIEAKPNEGGERPMVISDLYKNTPAVESGILPGDVILKIGKRRIKTPRDLRDATFFARVGEKLPILVTREGKEQEFLIEITNRPERSKLVEMRLNLEEGGAKWAELKAKSDQSSSSSNKK